MSKSMNKGCNEDIFDEMTKIMSNILDIPVERLIEARNSTNIESNISVQQQAADYLGIPIALFKEAADTATKWAMMSITLTKIKKHEK